MRTYFTIIVYCLCAHFSLAQNPLNTKDKIGIENPFTKKGNDRKLIRFNGANISYIYDYRSAIDTPYAEKNIGQHQVISQFSLTIANTLPVSGYLLARKSNSRLFRDILDVQLQFDAASFRNGLSERVRRELTQSVESLKDSMTEKLYHLKESELSKLRALFNKFSMQQLVQANETINIPATTYDLSLPDSVNKRRYDSMRTIAQNFLEEYNRLRATYARVSHQVDSLKKIYETSVEKVRELQQFIKDGRLSDAASYKALQRKLNKHLPTLPAHNNWLMNVKAMSIGRSALSSSELTAKNISQTGVNFVYNSWYYLGVSAGIIDYRFRDFAIRRRLSQPQYMYLLRAGLGSIERNYVIFSFFQGQKQLFTTSSVNARSQMLRITGVSAEANWQLNRSSYLLAEVAQSFTPSLYEASPADKNAADENKAVYVKLHSFIPKTGSRIEAHYKYTGANYQAFNSFQTNASLTSWSVKADQSVFGRKLRLVASVSTNDFQNPFIGRYESNTVFKTITATWRSKRFPVMSLGFQPMSQVTMVDSFLQESRFQTFNASVSHFYRIGEASASSNFFYTRFFNESRDSGFVYYNANNLFAGQSIIFKKLTINVSVSQTKNADYTYTVFDESIELPVSDKLSIEAGVKINRLNRALVKTGGYMNADIYLFKGDLLSFRVERSYFPSDKGGLTPTVFGNIQFSKTIR